MAKDVGGPNKSPAEMGVFDGFEHVTIVDLTAIQNIDNQQIKMLNVETFQQILLLEFEVNNKQNVLDVIEQLRFTPGIYYAAPNYFRELTSTRIPNDHFFSSLWGIQSIQAAQAWAITTGSRNVRVGIIDIGFQSHNDLNANLANGFCFFTNQVLTTANLGTTLPTATIFHGNHVAGTVGAVGNNSIGVVGVNWHVSLVPLEVFSQFGPGNDPLTTDARMIQAITWSINNNVPIINMSLGGFGSLITVRNHIQNNYAGLAVWSAGNASSNIDNRIPNSGIFNVANIIGVGALGPDNQRATYSCFGATSVSIYAPGGQITGGQGGILSTALSHSYMYMQGTSMAAPHVAGVAALLLSANSSLTGAQLKDLIVEGSIPLTVSTPVGIQSTRRLSAFGALQALSEMIWDITLSQTETHVFPTVYFGYDAQTPLRVGIENVGNQPTGQLTIALSGANASSFVLSRTTIPSLDTTGTADFTVVPNTGLPVGTYLATVTVRGSGNISESFDVRFTVNADPTSIVVVETGHTPSLQAHPNPFTDEIRIVNAVIGQMLHVLNVGGIVVHTQRITQENQTIQLGHLPAGTYILRVGEQSIRIVKN